MVGGLSARPSPTPFISSRSRVTHGPEVQAKPPPPPVTMDLPFPSAAHFPFPYAPSSPQADKRGARRQTAKHRPPPLPSTTLGPAGAQDASIQGRAPDARGRVNMNETSNGLCCYSMRRTTTTASTTGMAGRLAGWLVRRCRPFHVSNLEPNRTSGGLGLDLGQ